MNMKKLILLGSAFYFAVILISMLIPESAYAQAGTPRFGGTDDFDNYDSSLPAGKWVFYGLFIMAVWWGIMQLIEDLPIPESLGALIYGCWFCFGLVGLMMIPPVYFISATLIVFAVIFLSIKLSENTNLQNSPETKKSDKWIKDKEFAAEQSLLKENEKTAATATVEKWVIGTTYFRGHVVLSPSNSQSYRATSVTNGIIDPRFAHAFWELIGVAGGISTEEPNNRIKSTKDVKSEVNHQTPVKVHSKNTVHTAVKLPNTRICGSCGQLKSMVSMKAMRLDRYVCNGCRMRDI